MPYDPALPAANAPLASQVIRDQFQALFNLINSIVSVTAAQVVSTTTLPPGSSANASVNVMGNSLHFSFDIPQGPPGAPFAQAVVDSVNTLDPGQPAAVGVSFDGSNVRFTFDIPRGNDGTNGSNGMNGNEGPPGPQGGEGPQGPPFAQAIVDGVTTLNPGDSASVSAVFDGSNVRFQFGIPRGFDGNNGNDGAQGPAGEVSQAQLDAAMSGTSANTNSVSTLGQWADGSYNPTQMQDVLNKLDELITTLRR
jgi:hypothetical protein